MTRRDWLKSVAALAGASLVPTWFLPRAIYLAPFCGQEDQLRRYDMRAPFVQGAGDRLFSYATDA